jgi:hypothetical protein
MKAMILILNFVFSYPTLASFDKDFAKDRYPLNANSRYRIACSLAENTGLYADITADDRLSNLEIIKSIDPSPSADVGENLVIAKEEILYGNAAEYIISLPPTSDADMGQNLLSRRYQTSGSMGLHYAVYLPEGLFFLAESGFASEFQTKFELSKVSSDYFDTSEAVCAITRKKW